MGGFRQVLRDPKIWVPLLVLVLVVGGGASAVLVLKAHSHTQSASGPKPTGPPPTSSAASPREQVGWPESTTTGVIPGSQLSTINHDVSISKSGTVLSDKVIHGDVTIVANDVKIINSRIYGQVTIPYGSENVRGVALTDVELNGQRKGAPTQAEPGITTYGGFSCIRCNVHGFNLGIAIDGDQPTLVQDSWVHDIWPPSPGHKDAIITNGSSNVTIAHNRLSCEVDGCSAAIGLFGDFSAITNWVVNDNLFNGGSYCSYSGSLDQKKYPVASNIKWTNNHYGHEIYPDCGIYGPATGWSPAPGNTWSGNTISRGTPGGSTPHAAVPEPQS